MLIYTSNIEKKISQAGVKCKKELAELLNCYKIKIGGNNEPDL